MSRDSETPGIDGAVDDVVAKNPWVFRTKVVAAIVGGLIATVTPAWTFYVQAKSQARVEAEAHAMSVLKLAEAGKQDTNAKDREQDSRLLALEKAAALTQKQAPAPRVRSRRPPPITVVVNNNPRKVAKNLDEALAKVQAPAPAAPPPAPEARDAR